MDIPDRDSNRLRIIIILVLIGVFCGFALAIYYTKSVREGIGVSCLLLGTDLIMPNPSFDWFYFVFPTAFIILALFHNSISWPKSVLLAYALSHIMGAILLLIAIWLLGKERVYTNVKNAFNYLINNPYFIWYVAVITIIIVLLMIYDLRSLKEEGKQNATKK